MKKALLFSLMFLLLIGIVSAVPSFPHAFRGTAKFTDGTSVPDGYVITAKLENQEISTSSVVKNGEYGYTDPLLVSDTEGTGGKVYFYINDKLVQNDPVDFIIGEVTRINLVVEGAPTIPPSNNGGSSSGGGSSGGGGGSSSTSTDCIEDWRCTAWSDPSGICGERTCQDAENCGTTKFKPDEQRECGTEESNTLQGQNLEKTSGITGAVTGIFSTGRGTTIFIFVVVIIILAILIAVARTKGKARIVTVGKVEIVDSE